jgi:uncharacterized protein
VIEMGKAVRRAALLLAGLAGLASPGVTAPVPAPAPVPAAAPRSEAERPPRPAIWLVEDADTKIYLFGTVHVFPASLRWRSPALNRVIAEAQELVMETPDASAEDMNVAQRIQGPMRLGKSVPILERVSPRARPYLQQVLASTGQPIEIFNQMTTWGVAFMLTGYQISQAAGDGEDGPVQLSGAEEVLGALFRKSRRPISGVETVEEQINVFASMPLDAQRRFLESVVVGEEGDESGEPQQPQEATEESWVSGNVEGIAAEMRGMGPDMYQALLTRRNRNWTGWLARRMERPGVVLFAVGAGHLAGPDSVQTMLAARGIQARRVD